MLTVFTKSSKVEGRQLTSAASGTNTGTPPKGYLKAMKEVCDRQCVFIFAAPCSYHPFLTWPLFFSAEHCTRSCPPASQRSFVRSPHPLTPSVLCRFMLDEVMSGMGRLGSLHAWETYGDGVTRAFSHPCQALYTEIACADRALIAFQLTFKRASAEEVQLFKESA